MDSHVSLPVLTITLMPEQFWFHERRDAAIRFGPKIACVRDERRIVFRMPPTTRVLPKEISQENKEDHPVVQHLQRQMANAFVLYANYKHYHWQTFGPLFRDLHKLFDE